MVPRLGHHLRKKTWRPRGSCGKHYKARFSPLSRACKAKVRDCFIFLHNLISAFNISPVVNNSLILTGFCSVQRSGTILVRLKVNSACFAVHKSSSSSSLSVGCRAGDYKLPPATTILCQLRQLAWANHVVCVSQNVLNVSEKQGSLSFWFSLPMWWNIQSVLLAWLIIRHPEYMAQKPQLAGSDISTSTAV